MASVRETERHKPPALKYMSRLMNTVINIGTALSGNRGSLDLPGDHFLMCKNAKLLCCTPSSSAYNIVGVQVSYGLPRWW